jgi:hypothetical protein
MEDVGSFIGLVEVVEKPLGQRPAGLLFGWTCVDVMLEDVGVMNTLVLGLLGLGDELPDDGSGRILLGRFGRVLESLIPQIPARCAVCLPLRIYRLCHLREQVVEVVGLHLSRRTMRLTRSS